jgi:hypothetical protein
VSLLLVSAVGVFLAYACDVGWVYMGFGDRLCYGDLIISVLIWCFVDWIVKWPRGYCFWVLLAG